MNDRELGMSNIVGTIASRKIYIEGNMREKMSFHAVRPYFEVTNAYVVRRLFFLLFPFRHMMACVFPRMCLDIDRDALYSDSFFKKIDLYIPVMSFITHILLTGLDMGMRGVFTVENMSIRTSRKIFFLLVNVVATALVVNFRSVDNMSLLSVLSLVSYKYATLCASKFLSFLFHPLLYRLLYLYLLVAVFMFCVNFLKPIVFRESYTYQERKKSGHNIFAIASLEVFFFLLVNLLA